MEEEDGEVGTAEGADDDYTFASSVGASSDFVAAGLPPGVAAAQAPPPPPPRYSKQRTEALYREAERRVHAREIQRRQEAQSMSFMPVFEAQRSFKPEKPVFDRLYMDASKRSQVLAAKMQISQVVPPECTFVPEVSHSKIVQRSKGKKERSSEGRKEQQRQCSSQKNAPFPLLVLYPLICNVLN